MAEQKHLDIAFHMPQQGLRVGFPTLLNRVLLTLLTNGIKYTVQGRVEVVVEGGEDGGTLQVDSHKGEATRFHFEIELPRA